MPNSNIVNLSFERISQSHFIDFNLVVLILQIRGMHTLIRDREISKHDFVFYSDRLIRLVSFVSCLTQVSFIP